jgi:hypothetical protein
MAGRGMGTDSRLTPQGSVESTNSRKVARLSESRTVSGLRDSAVADG